MRGPRPVAIRVSERQRAELERIVRRASSPQVAVLRAKCILAAAAGHNNEQIAQRLGMHCETVRIWRGRWAAAADRLAAVDGEGDGPAFGELIAELLADQPRRGAPVKFRAEQVCQIVAVACEAPARLRRDRPVTHWTPRELADEVVKRGIVTSISPRSVGRFLK